MRGDSALAKELGAILDGLHDPTVSDDPFVWSATEGEQQRRHDELRTVRERLASFVYVSRASTIAKLLGMGTLLPLVLLALLFAADLPRNPALRAGTWGPLAVTGGVFVIVAISVWWRPKIDRDISYAVYAIPRGWSFSFLNGAAAWQQLRQRFSYFDRGDEDQSINARIWGFFDDADATPRHDVHLPLGRCGDQDTAQPPDRRCRDLPGTHPSRSSRHVRGHARVESQDADHGGGRLRTAA